MTPEQYNHSMAAHIWPVAMLPQPLSEYWARDEASKFVRWVKTYQSIHGLLPDGMLGPLTWKRMAIPCTWLKDFEIRGKGLWLWRVAQLDGGSLHGQRGIHSAANRMRRAGIRHAFLKVADGRSTMPGDLVATAKILDEHDIKVFPWVFPYAYPTDSPLKQEIDLHRDLAVKFHDELGSDVFVINAERGFLHRRYSDNGIVRPKHKEHAIRYTQGLRPAGVKLAISSYGLADDWSRNSFAWTEFLENTDYWMPQSYWSVKSAYKNKPELAIERGVDSWLTHWKDSKPTGIPIIPSGGCYQTRREVAGEMLWRGHYHSPAAIQRYLKCAKELQMPHSTFWCYMTPDKGRNSRVTTDQWTALGSRGWWF